MGLIEVAGESGNHFFFLVNDYIADESQLGLLGGVDHIPVNGVAVQDAGAGKGAVNESGAVIGQYGGPAGDSGEHTLAPAGETGKEVGLNEALSHQQVRLGGQLVDEQLASGGQGAQRYHVLILAAEMDGKVQAGPEEKLLAVFVQHLFPGGGAVEAGGHQHGDLCRRGTGPDLIYQLGQNNLAGDRAGVIAADNDNLMLAFGQFPERGRADGVLQSLPHQLSLVGLRPIALCAGAEDRRQALVRDLSLNPVPSVRKGNRLHR